MIVIGELINASRKAVKAAIESQDKGAIEKIAREQAEAGADFIDVNAGIFVDQEARYLAWLVSVAQAAANKPCAIDSPNPQAVAAALDAHQDTGDGSAAMINSISLEKERYDKLMPIIKGTDLKVIALCVSDKGLPQTVDDRLRIADKLINALLRNDVRIENIFVDPLVQPLSVNTSFGLEFLNAVEGIVKAFPGVHTACGLSNISYGLPARKLLNQAFMVMAIAKGLDGAIVNPLDRGMMANIAAAEALVNRDSFCGHYLKAYRAGRLDPNVA